MAVSIPLIFEKIVNETIRFAGLLRQEVEHKVWLGKLRRQAGTRLKIWRVPDSVVPL
jgi:hypothetical protein